MKTRVATAILPLFFVQINTFAECTFKDGYMLGLARDPYQNNCPQDSEPLFLKGYAIGRKLAWVESDLEQQNQLVSCLHTEASKRFGKTRSLKTLSFNNPTGSNIPPDENNQCNLDELNTESELNEKITSAEKLKSSLGAKLSQLQKLHDRSLINPEQIDEFIAVYEKSGTLDEFDVLLRWKPYVVSRGGSKHIDRNTRELIRHELVERTTIPTDLIWRSVVGFGMGHKSQDRFEDSGWGYAVIDTAVLLSLFIGLKNKDSLSTTIGVLGIPISRGYQLVDVQENHFRQNLDIDDLRTQWTPPTTHSFSFRWSW